MNLKACRQQTWIVTLLCVGHCFCAVTLTQSSTNVDKGSSLNIIATFDEASLTWTYKEGTPLSTCSLALNTCFPSLEENMGFTVSSTTNTSTLSIASLNCSINTAVYVASTDSLLTDTVNIDVTTPVSSRVSTTVLTASKVQSQDLLVEVKCVYPRSTITANFTISRSGKPDDILFPDSIQTSTSSSGCECFEDTYVVKKTITALQYPNEVVQVQANIGQLSPLVIGDVNFTAGKSDATDDTHNTCLLVIQGVWGSVKGLLFCIIDKFAECVQFTYYVVQQWYFTCRYVFKGKVVYGLQLVIIAAITQLISMIPLLLAFTVYLDNIRSYAYILIPVLFAVGPFIAVGIYLLYKRYCGQKEWLYTKFNTERATVKLSNEYGKKLNTVTKDKIYFKVKARNDLFITLLDDQQKPIVDIILGGYRQQSTHGVTQNDRVVYVKDVLVSTECRIFVLECGHSYITVTALSREIEKPLLKWELTNDDQGLEVCDIVISNFMQVGSYIRNENSTGYVQLEMTMQIENQSEIRNLEEQFGYPGEQSGNPGECTFLLRQGDCLLDNEDESCGLSCGICFVILFPIPWILCLLLRKLTDTNWIGLKLSSVLCCQNSVKPKAKEDILLNVPIVLTNISPKGGKNTLPAIGTTTTNENKPKKKKKKSRKQGESTRKTFPQDDTDNNEINTEADQYNK